GERGHKTATAARPGPGILSGPVRVYWWTRMLDPVRQEVIALAHTVVVKVGTNVLTAADGRLAPERLRALADQVQRLRQAGRKVALVSSGAIGAGVGRLGL